MAAVLSPRIDHSSFGEATDLRSAPWNDPTIRTDRARLRLVEGGRSTATATVTPHAGSRTLWVLVGGLALAVLVALAALGAVHLLGADAAASGPASTAETLHPAGAGASTPPASAEVVIQPGDTLWSVARGIQPDGDVRPLVDELARRAGGAAVVAGQHIDLTGLVG